MALPTGNGAGHGPRPAPLVVGDDRLHHEGFPPLPRRWVTSQSRRIMSNLLAPLVPHRDVLRVSGHVRVIAGDAHVPTTMSARPLT